MRVALLLVCCQLLLGFARAQDMFVLKGDLKGAPLILVNQSYTFVKPPSGYGNLKEFKINAGRSTSIFKEERNSAWFIVNIPFNGILTFDLEPHQIKDDYDWMLFRYHADLEKSIRNEAAFPLRSNNARNAASLSSKTGMGSHSKSNLVKPGPGNNYSLPLKVRSGEKLALIIDNIYGGKGFDILISVKPDIGDSFVFLEGYVKDRQNSNPLAAEITIDDDSTGVLIGKTLSDPVSGWYKLKVPASRPVNITAWHPAYIFATADTFITRNSNLDFLLDSPVSSNKLVLNNIHFHPNKDEILPSSAAELDRLLLFMKTRPDWTIKITGHTNPNVFASARYLQQLSFNRAVAVKNFLIKNDVSGGRISCVGVGGKMPLIVTKDPELGLKNLRVEVTLVKKR